MTLEQTIRSIIREELKQEFDRRKIPAKLSPQVMAESEGWLVAEAASIYSGLQVETLRRLARSGLIRASKAKGSKLWRFRQADIDEYMTSGRKKAKPEDDTIEIPQNMNFSPIRKSKTIL